MWLMNMSHPLVKVEACLSGSQQHGVGRDTLEQLRPPSINVVSKGGWVFFVRRTGRLGLGHRTAERGTTPNAASVGTQQSRLTLIKANSGGLRPYLARGGGRRSWLALCFVCEPELEREDLSVAPGRFPWPTSAKGK